MDADVAAFREARRARVERVLGPIIRAAAIVYVPALYLLARTLNPVAYLGSVLDNLLRHPATEGYGVLVVAAVVFATAVVVSTARESRPSR